MTYRRPLLALLFLSLLTIVGGSCVVDNEPTNSYRAAIFLRITSISSRAVKFEWTNAEMYPFAIPAVMRPISNTIQRSESNNTFITLAIIHGDSTSYVDQGLDSTQSYTYRVESSFSDTSKIVSLGITTMFGPSFPLMHSILPEDTGNIFSDASLDGEYVALAEANGSFQLIDSQSGTIIQETTLPQPLISRVTFSETGLHVLTLASNPAGTSQLKGLVSVYQIPSLALVGTSPAQDPTSPFALVDSILITSGESPSLLFSNINDGSIIAEYSPDNFIIRAIEVSPDRSLLACGTFSVTRIIDIKTQAVAKTLGWPSKSAITLSFSQNGRFLATGSEGHSILIWSIPEWQTWQAFGTSSYQAITASAFTNDNQYLITAGFGGDIRFWNLSDGAQFRKLTGHSAEILRLRVSQDGLRLISCGMDMVNVWSLKSTNLWFTTNP